MWWVFEAIYYWLFPKAEEEVVELETIRAEVQKIELPKNIPVNPFSPYIRIKHYDSFSQKFR